MMRTFRSAAACVLFAALTGLLPAAADAQVVGTATVPTTQGQLKVVALGYRASKLLKSRIYNVEGKRIGEVDDFVVTQSAAVSFIILEVGGFLGIGKKEVALPVSVFKMLNGKLVLPGMTADSLKKLPAFTFSRL